MVAVHGMRNGDATGALEVSMVEATVARDRAEIVTVTPAVAAVWLERMHFPNQRTVRERHVEYLAEEIKAGRFRLSTLDIRECGDRDYLVNGQHRLHAVVRAGRAVEFAVVRRRVSDFEEAARDYATFDRGMVRTHTDGLLGYGLTAETGLTAKQLGRLSSCAPFIVGGFRSFSRNTVASTQARAEFIRAWVGPALHACSVIGESNLERVRKLYNGPCYSVALVTFRYAPERAETFWGRVAANDGLHQGDPEMALIEFTAGRAMYSGRQSYTARAVATCWNAAYQGRSLRHVKVMDPNAPIRIAGTPYTGKDHVEYKELS